MSLCLGLFIVFIILITSSLVSTIGRVFGVFENLILIISRLFSIWQYRNLKALRLTFIVFPQAPFSISKSRYSLISVFLISLGSFLQCIKNFLTQYLYVLIVLWLSPLLSPSFRINSGISISLISFLTCQNIYCHSFKYPTRKCPVQYKACP